MRWDPLTGQSCRLLPRGSLPRPAAPDIEELGARTQPTCPFCAEQLEQETPVFHSDVHADGRIHVGEAVLFPNLVPYAKWNAVSVYSPERHVLRLEELTPALIADNLTAQVQFARAIVAHDSSSAWSSVNANHLPPSGSSIFHPHLQGSAHPTPTTAQRAFAELDASGVRDYIEAERDGERFIGSTEAVVWLASFAPAGVAEVRAFVDGAASIVDLGAEAIADLASGLSRVLAVYAELGFQSFNLAIHGAAGSLVVLRVVARAYFGPLARSDVMWSERLHAELTTDTYPEDVAALARSPKTLR